MVLESAKTVRYKQIIGVRLLHYLRYDVRTILYTNNRSRHFRFNSFQLSIIQACSVHLSPTKSNSVSTRSYLVQLGPTLSIVIQFSPCNLLNSVKLGHFGIQSESVRSVKLSPSKFNQFLLQFSYWNLFT